MAKVVMLPASPARGNAAAGVLGLLALNVSLRALSDALLRRMPRWSARALAGGLALGLGVGAGLLASAARRARPPAAPGPRPSVRRPEVVDAVLVDDPASRP